jgi:ABC-type transport system substrate-binding protein
MRILSKGTMVIFVLSVFSLLVLAACSSGDSDAGSEAEATAVPSAAQPKVNRLIMAVVPLSGVETNELRHSSSPTVWPYRSVYDYPIALDINTGQLMPGLAESWSVDPDGKSLRVKLRKGVEFHGGYGEFTAKDLVAMWKDISKEDSRHGQSGWWASTMEDVEVINDHEVVYHPVGTAYLVESISEIQGGMEVRSSAQVEAKGGNPETLDWAHAGTGPYQFKSREPGTKIVLERAPGKHWSGAVPDFPEFEYRFMPEVSTRLASLLTGEVHMAHLPDDLLTQALSEGMETRVGIFPGVRLFGWMYCCYLNEKKNPDSGYKFPDSPLMNVKVREALNKAINRDEMNKALFNGKGLTMYLNHFNSSRPGWEESWIKRFPAAYGYDPVAAKALLAEAGYGPNNPLTTTIPLLNVTGISGGKDLAETVTGYLEAIGVDVNLEGVDAAAFRAATRAGTVSNTIRMFGTGSSLWTGVGILNSSHTRGFTGVNVLEAERHLLTLVATVDEAKRDAIWRDIGEAMFTNYGSIHLFWLPAEATVDPEIVGDWAFPGAITGTWTHVHNIKAAR